METNLHYRLTHDEVTNTPICDGYVSVPCSPAIKNTESNDERVKKLLQRMSARHLDLIRELSEKNREKEEQLRREEQRQRKRESSLRSRILARTGSLDVDDKEKMGDLPTLPPDETASAEERRLWKLKCNADIEKRQQEAINRLQEFQKARSLKLQREQLKREWRAHRAKSYLLEQCQNSEIKEYLESKEKPKALPRLPSHSASASPARILAARRRDASEEPREEPRSEPEEAGQTAPEDGSPNAEAAPSPSSVQAAEVTEAEVEVEAAESPPISFKGSPSAPSKPRMGPSRSEYISRFVSRMRNAQIAMKCARHLSDWKRLHSCPQSSPVFICAGGYPDFTNAMRRRGWFQNEDKDSRFFDVKWAPAAAIDHDNLLTGQVVNHFHGNREITTKVGLTLNLRNCLPMCGADPDAFYPRAYDLYEPGERSEFAMNFKFTKAQAILREFLRNLDGRAAMTFSSDVVRLAYKICLRLVTDPADVMDSPELAEGLNADILDLLVLSSLGEVRHFGDRAARVALHLGQPSRAFLVTPMARRTGFHLALAFAFLCLLVGPVSSGSFAGNPCRVRKPRHATTVTLCRVRPEHKRKLYEAKQSLSRDSDLLKAKKRVTTEIASCRCIEDVVGVVSSTRPQELDEISMAASVTRIAQLQDTLQASQLQTAGFKTLLERMEQCLHNPAVRPSAVAGVLWAIASARQSIPELRQLLPAAILGLQASVLKMQEREVTNSIWAIATLHTYIPESRACLDIEGTCDSFASNQAAFAKIQLVQAAGNALWSLGRLKEAAHPKLQKCLQPVLLGRCRDLLACDVFEVDRTVKLTGVARIAWALSLLECRDEGIMVRVRELCIKVAPKYSGNRLLPFVDVLCALAKLNMSDGGLLEAVASRPWTVKSMRDWDPCHLTV
eukprot:s386_g5.t2